MSEVIVCQVHFHKNLSSRQENRGWSHPLEDEFLCIMYTLFVETSYGCTTNFKCDYVYKIYVALICINKHIIFGKTCPIEDDFSSKIVHLNAF